MSKKNSWWKAAQNPASIRSDSHEWIYQWAQQALAIEAMKNNKPAPLRVGGAGPIANPEAYQELRTLFATKKATLAEESFYAWDDDFEEVYVWDTGAAFVTSADDSSQLGINVVTTDYEFAEKIRSFIHSNILRTSKTNQGRVYILVAGPDGVKPSPLGFAAVPLEVRNYDPSIQEALVKVVQDLQTPFPDGRLTILEGPPGCGKTFLIRSLVHEIPGAKFIFVPPAMVPNLGDPSLVSALLGLREDHHSEEDTYNGPTVLICEDADSILTSRGADNMPAISSVLNLTSGLLGDVIDIRVVATTNAPKTDIEPALLRNGRLAQYIAVPPVEREQADEILNRLLEVSTIRENWPAAKVPVYRKRDRAVGFASNDEVELVHKVLLADIFKVAKKHGWKPKKIKAKVDQVKIVPRRPRPYTEADGAQFLKHVPSRAGTDRSVEGKEDVTSDPKKPRKSSTPNNPNKWRIRTTPLR